MMTMTKKHFALLAMAAACLWLIRPALVLHAQTQNTGSILYLDVNVSSNGDNTVQAAIPGQTIQVLFGDLVASGAVTVTVKSSGGTVLDGPMAFGANGGKIYAPDAPANRGHFITKRGEGLVINLNGATQVGGHLVCLVQ